MNTRTPPSSLPAEPADTALRLLAFNQHLIEQALALASAHVGPGKPPYAGQAGSHLRHVIEHYEALFAPTQAGVVPAVVDYDARARDPKLDVSPQLARTRLQTLHHLLARHPAHAAPALLHEPLLVRGQGGLVGDFDFQVTSSLGRELAFVASHTVHHFALLAAYCRQHGITTPDGFGKAPATRAHELAGSQLACA